MKTCNSSYSFRQKLEVSRRIRKEFLALGYTGILACNRYKPNDDCEEFELVVFDLDSILSIERIDIPENEDSEEFGYY